MAKRKPGKMIIKTYGNENSSIVLIQMVYDHDLEVIESELTTMESVITDFYLITVKVNDWNHDLSPWRADAVFGNEVFTGGASDTLKEVMATVADRIRKAHDILKVTGLNTIFE